MLFFVSGFVLLALTYGLVSRRPTGGFYTFDGPPPPAVLAADDRGGPASPEDLKLAVDRQSAAVLDQLLTQSAAALVTMTVVSVGLGWVIAGRALRPLRTMNAAARAVSASNLDERLVLTGPRDELHQLGSTFNDLLGRLEAAFEAQRLFVANASHELRTPLAVQRAMLEVAMADPALTLDSLRATCGELLESGRDQERLLDALLALAQSERVPARIDTVDLADMVGRVLELRRPDIDRRGLRATTALEPARTAGDPRLVERLLDNLVVNAVVHNVTGGSLDVATSMSGGRSTVSVSNSGRVVEAGDVQRLLGPFERTAASRADHGDGSGLGLSIVRAVVRAHDADLMVTPLRTGGLRVDVRFHAAAPVRRPLPGLRQGVPGA